MEVLGIQFVELFIYPIDRRAVALVAPAICRHHELLPPPDLNLALPWRSQRRAEWLIAMFSRAFVLRCVLPWCRFSLVHGL